MKNDKSKSRVDLIPARAIIDVGHVLKFGATKYGEDNWKTLPDGIKRYRAAALRHLLQAEYEEYDEESKISHYTHAAANLMFIIELERK